MLQTNFPMKHNRASICFVTLSQDVGACDVLSFELIYVDKNLYQNM